MISRDTTDGFRLIAAAMPFCCICAARQREISSLSANVSISRRTLPPIHSRVRQSLSLKGNPSHGDPIRRVGRAGRSGRDKPDDRGSVGTSAQRALPRPHSRPPGPGPRRASRRHHAPPIWRVGVEQQYIAAGWTSTRSALLVFPQVGDFGPLPAQLRSHKSDSMIFLPGIPPWQIVSVIIVRCWGSGSRSGAQAPHRPGFGPPRAGHRRSDRNCHRIGEPGVDLHRP